LQLKRGSFFADNSKERPTFRCSHSAQRVSGNAAWTRVIATRRGKAASKLLLRESAHGSMGFYIRKSIRVGALRFNLSKSGIGISGGIPGFRIGTGPRGTYVHAGMGGCYYRQHLFAHPANHGRRRLATPTAQPKREPLPGTITIVSAPADRIVSSSASTLLSEIETKRKRVPLSWLGTIGWLVFALWLATAEGASLHHSVRLAQHAVAATHLGKVAGILQPSLAALVKPPLTAAKARSIAGLLLLALTPLIMLALRLFDRQRRAAVVMYDLDPGAERVYRQLYDALFALGRCHKLWSVMSTMSTAATRDYKRNAGATKLLQRSSATISSACPTFIQTNISVPVMRLHRDTLYFFPNRVFIENPARVGAVSYPDFQVASQSRTSSKTDSSRATRPTSERPGGMSTATAPPTVASTTTAPCRCWPIKGCFSHRAPGSAGICK
jgi:hypothetical protein